MRPPRRLTALLGACVLAATGLVAATAGATRATAHLSHDQQVAAKAATSAYRTQMTQAGQQLASSLLALDASLTDPAAQPDPTALAQARSAFDVVRVQMGDPGAASAGGGAPTLASALWSTEVLRGAHVELAQAAPVLTVVLGRIILSPQAVAQSAQRASAWIARSAPGVLDGRAPVSRTDLATTARSITVTLAGLSPIGRLVSPEETAASIAAADRLVAATSSSTSTLRQIVGDADVLSLHLGRVGGDLDGYGKGSLYQ